MIQMDIQGEYPHQLSIDTIEYLISEMNFQESYLTLHSLEFSDNVTWTGLIYRWLSTRL